MTVVLDTNVLLVAIPARSRYHLIFQAFVAGRYSLAVTTDILDEYAEIIATHGSPRLFTETLETIESAENVVQITRYFAFGLIKADPDDNKFVDCAIASNADFIVTNDAHFRVLSQIPFPRVRVVSPDDFMYSLNETGNNSIIEPTFPTV